LIDILIHETISFEVFRVCYFFPSCNILIVSDKEIEQHATKHKKSCKLFSPFLLPPSLPPFLFLPPPKQGAHRRVGIDFNLRGALLDTKGPEIRTGSFEGGVKHVEIPSGAEVILTTDPAWKDKGTAEKVYVDYGALGRTCKKGGNILLDDGIIKLEVIEPLHRVFHTDDPTKPITETLCVVKNRNPVTLGARKGTNIPGAILELPALTERDKRDLEWGVDNDVDFVAASFVRKAADVRSVIVHLERLMAKQKPTTANPRLVRPVVISKIENAEAIANFDEILAESDGIMVARGDLGVRREGGREGGRGGEGIGCLFVMGACCLFCMLAFVFS